MADKIFDPEREIDNTKLSSLRALGYLRGETIEDLLLILNEEKFKAGLHKVEGKGWWIKEKEKAEKKGTPFIDHVYDLLTVELKKQKGVGNGK